MKRQKKKYSKPTKPYDKERIEREKVLLKEFGLNRKKELWGAEALLRKYRRQARELAASRDEKKEKILIDKLVRHGILNSGATLDDVLSLNVKNFLERRLASLIFKRGLVNSVRQARQFVSHGHVSIGGRKIVYPGYLVKATDENRISVEGGKTIASPDIPNKGDEIGG